MDAAEQLFFEHGFALTSTTDIARLAGCNQALVHYYYRSKENLFRQIFLRQVNGILRVVRTTLTDQTDFQEMVRNGIAIYFEALSKQPNLPHFVINELVNNQERRLYIRETFVQNPDYATIYLQFVSKVRQEQAAGRLAPLEPFDLLLHIGSLTVGTFISLPMYRDLLERNEDDVAAYLQHRQEEITRFILQGIML